jgi:Cid1 family poly A polymerase
VQVVAHLLEEGHPPGPLSPPRPDVPTLDGQLAYAATLAAAAARARLSHADAWPHDLGALLMNFLHRFGAGFDAGAAGVSVRQGGVVGRGASGGGAHQGGIAIEDPQARIGFRLKSLSGIVIASLRCCG